jgi:hypothetical protein
MCMSKHVSQIHQNPKVAAGQLRARLQTPENARAIASSFERFLGVTSASQGPVFALPSFTLTAVSPVLYARDAAWNLTPCKM